MNCKCGTRSIECLIFAITELNPGGLEMRKLVVQEQQTLFHLWSFDVLHNHNFRKDPFKQFLESFSRSSMGYPQFFLMQVSFIVYIYYVFSSHLNSYNTNFL